MLPVITIPWDCVLHDNHRLMPVIMKPRNGKAMVRNITSTEYRNAKAAAEIKIKEQWKGVDRISCNVAIEARCFFPNRIKRDAGNYRKLLTDSMTGIVYADDSQLVDERWMRVGFDKLNPRIEITVVPIPDEQTSLID